jgi:hypothetical protein
VRQLACQFGDDMRGGHVDRRVRGEVIGKEKNRMLALSCIGTMTKWYDNVTWRQGGD